MEPSPDFPVWSIVPDPGNPFGWVLSAGDPSFQSAVPQPSCPVSPPLPSMSDLLLQGEPQLRRQSEGGAPVLFRTGSGKSVPVRQDSIRKAMTVLGEEDDAGKENANFCEQSCSGFPMFQTGSGKSVTLKQSSIQRAMAVFGESDIMENGPDCNFSTLFQTGFGKTLDISPDGISRAKALLNLEENDNFGTSIDFTPTIKLPRRTELGNWENGCNMETGLSLMPGTSRIEDGNYNNGKINGWNKCLPQQQKNRDALQNCAMLQVCTPGTKKLPIMFQTAGCKSVSVSRDALKRAKGLLGDLELEPNEAGLMKRDKSRNEVFSNKENEFYESYLQRTVGTVERSENKLHRGRKFISVPRESISFQGVITCKDNKLRDPKTMDASSNTISNMLKPPRHDRPSIGPLVEISENIESSNFSQKHMNCGQRNSGRKNSTPPFKKPRRSRFSAPLSTSLFPSGSSIMPKSDKACTTRVSSRYPLNTDRKNIKEFFGGPPFCHSLIGYIAEKVKCMNADRAEKFVFQNCSGLNDVGSDALRYMLEQSGASLQKATREWVTNHYKWIVWKLASLERSYPAQASGRYLTVANVLEELKYRYDREVNHGHRSALRKILEGDVSPASMMVLCVSAVRSHPDENLHQFNVNGDTEKLDQKEPNASSNAVMIELTDGWYSINARLDAPLSKKLSAGRLFVGQKLRIWGAGLCSWVAPISPLEAPLAISLLLHINGTYRAHWADRMGLCRSTGMPLAFRCIKAFGGPVPLTLVGVTRIYPFLYKERLTNGGSVVRTERMESRTLQLYNQRRCTVTEGIISELKEDIGLHDSCDSEEGAKIFKLLATASEPEDIMADMNSEQLNSLAIYQAKKETVRQSNLLLKIEKALDEAGLSARQVTPFIKMRVAGLISKSFGKGSVAREGLITIWNPSEKQRANLIEGQIYSVAGLVPLKCDTSKLYLQGRGSMTTFKKLPPSAIDCFEPFFIPRKSISLLNLGQVALSSEFDIAAVIVYVGEVYKSVNQMKQWVFVTDGSLSGNDVNLEVKSSHLLAITFCIPAADTYLLEPVSNSLTGSTVSFCNLIKRPRDPVNHIWVAEATESSVYNDNLTSYPHLTEAVSAVREWARLSSEDINKLKEMVLSIVGSTGI